MIKKEQILVIIPARGGSKRIPKKNILKIDNKPIILWTLSEILKFIDKEKIIVSTDNSEIKKIVEDFGVSIPFTRPKELSDDFATIGEVAKHTLEWYEKKFFKVKYTLIIFPTAIFLDHADLDYAHNFMEKNQECSVFFGAAEYTHPIQRAIFMDDNKKIKMLNPQHYKSRTQDLKKYYYDAGQFYFCKSEIIRNQTPLFNENANFKILSKINALDIDYDDDIKLAEILMKSKNEK